MEVAKVTSKVGKLLTAAEIRTTDCWYQHVRKELSVEEAMMLCLETCKQNVVGTLWNAIAQLPDFNLGMYHSCRMIRVSNLIPFQLDAITFMDNINIAGGMITRLHAKYN
jgi:hypothetical protein